MMMLSLDAVQIQRVLLEVLMVELTGSDRGNGTGSGSWSGSGGSGSFHGSVSGSGSDEALVTAVNALLKTTGILSFFGALFIIISFYLLKDWSFPNNIIFMLSVCDFMHATIYFAFPDDLTVFIFVFLFILLAFELSSTSLCCTVTHLRRCDNLPLVSSFALPGR